MLKKVLFFALAITFVAVGLASAAQNVANTSQKGSLLVFPKILADPIRIPGDGIDLFLDTYITIGNDYYQEVWVKCYWMDSNQTIEDFMFRLTPNQPIIFSAKFGLDLDGFVTVPPFTGRGELKCWAVNASGTEQVSFNHLYGNAILAQENAAVVYNAWAFTARGGTLGQPFGIPGDLRLTGASGGYDACPQYLVSNFIPANSFDRLPIPWRGAINPDLTLVPCKQDLRQDRTPTCTKAKFDVWNENETKFTGAYQCVRCWWEGFLGEIGFFQNGNYAPKSGFGGDKFWLQTLHTYAARFRVQSANNSACKAYAFDCASYPGVLTPFLGVLLYAERGDDGGLLPFAGYTPFGAGADGSGYLLWDVQGGTPEAPQQ